MSTIARHMQLLGFDIGVLLLIKKKLNNPYIFYNPNPPLLFGLDIESH